MTDLVERLLADLALDGGEARTHPGGVLVERRDGRRLDPPAKIIADADTLAAFLASAEDDGKHLWPDVPPAVGAWRLLLTNLHEALAVGGTGIRVLPDEVVWDPPPLVSRFPSEGDFVWSAEPGLEA